MRAVVWTRYGPPNVLELREVEKPTPQDDELLIRVHATTVTAGDCEMRSLSFPTYFSLVMRLWRGLLKPRGTAIPGSELAGEIEAVGRDVKRFKVGDRVFGSAGPRLGTNAEYICLPEEPGEMEGGVALMPANMTYEEAATVPFGGRDALHFLRRGDVRAGQRVLINGAGGSIGTFAIQLAKIRGAKVVAVDSTVKLDMLRSLGADQVIDYTQEDFIAGGQVYDVIFDVVGTLSLLRTQRALAPDGTYLLANPMRSQMLSGLWTRMTSSRQVVMETASATVVDLVFLRELVEAGKLRTVVDRTYLLEQIVEAHRYVEAGGKLGNMVVAV
jgi:NADPH:quinone reductase-like Zn-dependent oxidoreductase